MPTTTPLPSTDSAPIVTGASQQMVFAKVNPTFTDLEHVDFFLDGIAAATLIAALIDDVDFSVTQ